MVIKITNKKVIDISAQIKGLHYFDVSRVDFFSKRNISGFGAKNNEYFHELSPFIRVQSSPNPLQINRSFLWVE